MSDVAYSTELVSQIRVLLGYMSARPELSLSKLVIEDANLPSPPSMNAGAIIFSLEEIESNLTHKPQPIPLTSRQLVLLQLTRDKLSGLVAPATGLTVAYTSMVTENSWFFAKTKVNLAKEAYPHFRTQAMIHRWSRNLFIGLALLLTITCVWLSTEVAVGKHLLQSMDALRIRQTTIANDEKQLETMIDKPGDGSLPLTKVIDRDNQTVNLMALRLCDRSGAYAEVVHGNGLLIGGSVSGYIGDGGGLDNPPLDGSPGERFLCGQDNVLRHDFVIVRTEINQWLTDWPAIVGGVFRPLGKIADYLSNDSNSEPRLSLTENTELRVAPRILAIGNYLLPVCFAMLGSTIYVLLEFWGKVRVSQLEPRDSWLSWIRLVLGLVLGTIIGLFFTSYGPIDSSQSANPSGSNLVASLSLSASGLAFLAGFGVEGVFNMLQELVQRVFSAKAQQSNASSSSPTTA